MKTEVKIIQSGYDKKKCLVHARCCFAPDIAVATSQYLTVAGSDLFSGIYSSISFDGGKSWSDFVEQKGLAPIKQEEYTIVGCDSTPIYHKKTGKILLLGHTACYTDGEMHPNGKLRQTFYSVFDTAKKEFGKMQLIDCEYENCGNGSGQSVELENGEILVPIYIRIGKGKFGSAVMKCAFDGEKLSVIEMGNIVTCDIGRGLYEPSIIFHKGKYYMTMRNDECGMVAKSEDGLNYTDLHLWCWNDGSIVDTYNTQQHWMVLGDSLYLVYTRRAENNGHVFRHRAPLFMARVENMKLVRNSEIVVVPERGARLGNFGVTDNTVMAAEWMQPAGCEKYGSDNSIFLTKIEE